MKILLLAGEESGLIYARRIAEEILRRNPAAEIRGYRDYGFDTGDLAVMGFWPVLRKLFFFLKVKRTMLKAVDEWRPDAVCTVDYPGMNLRIAAYAKAKGIRTVHVVSPQVWAWKKGRVPKVEAALDRLCCFFPFEPRYFKPGFATFVGHPLAEEWGDRQSDPSGREVAMLPGSRIGEIEKNLPIILAAAERLQARHPELKFTIPAANEKAKAAIEAVVGPRRNGFQVVAGGARELLGRAVCAAVASGTATLEAALAGCPTVLVYRVSALFAWLGRLLIREIHFIGLANIIWEKSLERGYDPSMHAEAPMLELIQEDFTAERLEDALERLVSSASARLESRKRLSAAVAPLRSDRGSIAAITDELFAQ